VAKSILKQKARLMRKDGDSVKSIALKLGVSSSTTSLWCRDIVLTKEQVKQLEKNSRDPLYGKRLDYAKQRQTRRIDQDKEIKVDAERMIGSITDRDKFIGGILLYWAEGFKKDNMVGFSNMDSSMISIFIDWLVNSLKVNKERIKLRIVINQSHKSRIDEIQNYWSKMTGVSVKEFYRPTLQKINWSKSYEHPEEYFGVLRVRVLKSTKLLKLIKFLIMDYRVKAMS